jgi:hypothetical protein
VPIPPLGELGNGDAFGDRLGAGLDAADGLAQLGFGLASRRKLPAPPLPTPAGLGIAALVDDEHPAAATLANVSSHCFFPFLVIGASFR